ncbi:hypothetical protein CRD60_06645 [Bifidobacterium aemilianum]|uniref:GNAT family N-acetyltransferase n=1 Tax=Bifidobacterium aemilianum TaxID=2493120 RepID=A0A366K8J2_9BIFI|nr:hypothetical protein CRD60_06645 [Bifidobacterium aemilianum]
MVIEDVAASGQSKPAASVGNQQAAGTFARPRLFVKANPLEGGQRDDVQETLVGGHPRDLHESDIDFTDFTCGHKPIDSWFHDRAINCGQQGTAVPYVSLWAEGRCAGFYTLSAFGLVWESLTVGWPKRNVAEHIPAVLLGMLGVGRSFQGQGLG